MLQVVSLTRDDQEMIVICPQWLCTDIIGKLLAHDSFNNRPEDGRFLLQVSAYVPLLLNFDFSLCKLHEHQYVCFIEPARLATWNNIKLYFTIVYGSTATKMNKFGKQNNK